MVRHHIAGTCDVLNTRKDPISWPLTQWHYMVARELKQSIQRIDQRVRAVRHPSAGSVGGSPMSEWSKEMERSAVVRYSPKTMVVKPYLLSVSHA